MSLDSWSRSQSLLLRLSYEPSEHLCSLLYFPFTPHSHVLTRHRHVTVVTKGMHPKKTPLLQPPPLDHLGRPRSVSRIVCILSGVRILIAWAWCRMRLRGRIRRPWNCLSEVFDCEEHARRPAAARTLEHPHRVDLLQSDDVFPLDEEVREAGAVRACCLES